MNNPYAPSASTEPQQGVFADHAERLHGGLLHREIQFTKPFAGNLVYDGKWFTQTIRIDGRLLWWRVSWKSIHPIAEFQIPPPIIAGGAQGRIEIDFSRALLIMRFRIWINDQLVYDELN
ncbi:hypothetical protein [Stieleria varia]|uniref:Uncharacterized protein n=1 Tax=Stieleria varia TaxID=2528005 RepID=A0A5C6AXW0_9BACT|nr:hypothetical protein [Stieleria varia]TWU04855.1 hypothetical protein Pla52n_29000 [Stieleria varia]